MAKLPEPPRSDPPYWDYFRHQLWQAVMDGADPAWFKNWPCIFHTMMENHWKEPMEVERQALCTERYVNAAKVDYGMPMDRVGEDLSRNMVHQVYHIMRWEQVTGQRIDELESIVEFGGGFGALALAIHRLGFHGTYYMIEVPEYALLQQFYFEKVGISVIHNPDTVKLVDLFIACHSISELPFEQRNDILCKYPATSYLFAYNSHFEHYDNLWYFQLPWLDVDHWKFEKIAHLESWYTWGW